MNMYNNDAPYSRIEAAFYAIKWKLDCANVLPNPCDMRFTKLLLAGLKRLLAKPVVKKEPVTPELLRNIVC